MKIDTQFNPLLNLNPEMNKKDKALERIGAALELGAQESASRSISDMLQSQISTMSQGLMNANDGIAMMQIAGGTVNSLSDQTQSLNDLRVKYNSAALNESQKMGLEKEFTRTIVAMQQSIESTTFNGKALFGNNFTFSIGDSALSSTIPTFSPTSLSIDNQDGIDAFRKTLDQASSDIGSSTNNFISATNTLLAQITSTASAKSQISDIDMANSLKDFQQSNLKLDVTQIAIAHQNDALRQNITRLLG